MLLLDSFDALAIALQQDPGAYALLVGSGLSSAAGIPTGWEITLELVRRLGAVKGASDQEDWAAWYQAAFGKAPSYSELLDALAATPTERRSVLHSFIEAEPDEELRRPTKAHRAVARLVAEGGVRVIVTTNFDRLIESALREVGMEPTVISNEDGVKGALPLVHSRCTVVKVHGDYMDARILNTEAELAAYPASLDALLDQVFDQFGLLVVGWSGEWDTALRGALLRAPSRRFSTFWATRGAPAALAADLIAHRSARTIEIADAETFLPKIADAVEALRQSARPHPASVAAGLALARRYCRDDAYGAEWAQLVTTEAERLRAYTTGLPNVRGTPETVMPVIDQIVGRSELLRRAVLFCARWGTPAANAQAVRVIRSLADVPSRSGFAVWSDLAMLAASLCFYWGLAGATERDDLTLAAAYINPKIRDKYQNTNVALVQVLPLTAYSENNLWNVVDQSRNAFKASLWLAAIFARESADISVLYDEATELLDKTEFLVAAEFGAYRLKADPPSYFWAPAGSYLLNRRHRTFADRVAELAKSAESGPLRTAGLLISDPTVAAEVGQQLTAFRGAFPIW